MRLRSKLFYVFLAVLLIIASIAEASKRRRRDGNSKKSKKQKLALTTLNDTPGSGGETLVGGSSGPSLESEKARDNRVSVGEASSTVEGDRSEVLSFAVFESDVESDDDLGKEFRKAVEGGNFGWLRTNWERWLERRDLLDYVIANDADVTVKIIQNVGLFTKRSILAALFDKGEGMIDDVLGGISYNDSDLWNLTKYRPELAGSPEKFFRVLDKIEEPKTQELTVKWGACNLCNAKRRDLVVPLVNALGKRTFKSENLKDVAIQWVFYEGAKGGNQDIVELYCEHPAITSEAYTTYGLYESWNYGKPNQVFQFLLEQADQGDLDKAKKKHGYNKDFCQAIDEALEVALPAGSRIISVEKVQHVLDVLGSITDASDEYGPSSIIKDYLLGEKEKTMGGGLEMHKKKIPASITLYGAPGSGGETLTERNSGLSLESDKAKDNKASIGEAFSTVEGGRSEIVSCADSGNDTESGDTLGVGFRKAVDGRNFGWLRANWWIWEDRKDLLDDVIAKGADFIVRFIQNVGSAKDCVLAALFDKGEKGMIAGVLRRIKYGDWNISYLSEYRPELAGSPEKFFRVLDKIECPWNQEGAVRVGVAGLFKAGRHDLVVPLVNALGKETFKSDRLQEEAIQKAFEEGTRRGNQDIVGVYYEHSMITSREYANGLHWSWHDGKPNQVFPFLLEQADQGDLDGAKEKYAGEDYENFCQAIDKAPKPIPPAGSRIISVEKVQHVLEMLASTTEAYVGGRPSSIIV